MYIMGVAMDMKGDALTIESLPLNLDSDWFLYRN